MMAGRAACSAPHRPVLAPRARKAPLCRAYSTTEQLRILTSVVSLNEQLVPSSDATNTALEVWYAAAVWAGLGRGGNARADPVRRKLIKAIPATDRLRILDSLGPAHIISLWELSQSLLLATADERLLAVGPAYSLRAEFPEHADAVRVPDLQRTPAGMLTPRLRRASTHSKARRRCLRCLAQACSTASRSCSSCRPAPTSCLAAWT